MLIDEIAVTENAADAAAPRLGARGFNTTLLSHGMPTLSRAAISQLQINLGKLCNQACNHCHVDAGPKRTEVMEWPTMRRIIDWVAAHSIKSIDITGGAPELNPHFRQMVNAFVDMGADVISRCNLTVLWERGQEDLAAWYAQRRVHLVCSLPCYSESNVDAQRGKGVFGKSIRALQLLNQHGYGIGSELTLDLVYNPGGPTLPPPQDQLTAQYKQRLFDDFGIRFNQLFTITNLPINRFKHYLERTEQLASYQQLLEDNFNPSTVEGLMCRHLVSVDWKGRLYDCDFNQMLDMPMPTSRGTFLWDLDGTQIEGQKIAVGRHCFGCTAGAGSSCGGALT